MRKYFKVVIDEELKSDIATKFTYGLTHKQLAKAYKLPLYTITTILNNHFRNNKLSTLKQNETNIQGK